MGTVVTSTAGDGTPSTAEVRRTAAAVGATLGETVRTTLGPTGMDKMFVDGNGMVLLTNDAKTLLGEMRVNLDLVPAAGLLADLAVEQDESVGDGTATAVALAGDLLGRAADLFERGVHPTTVADGYALAARRTGTALADAASAAPLDDGPGVDGGGDLGSATAEGAVRTAVAGWGNDRDEATLASLLVEAATELAATGDVDWDRVTVTKVPGGRVADSYLQRGVLYEGEPVHAAMPRLLEPARVACLNTNLTPRTTTGDHGPVTLDGADDADRLLAFEAETVEARARRLVDSGANAVFSDKSVDERAQQFFADRGVLAVRRVAESELRAIARATGAAVTDAGVVDPSDLGRAASIEHGRLGGEDVFTVATEDADCVAVVVRGGSKQVLNEMERAVRSGFAALRALSRDPRVVPGGGAAEVGAAMDLRAYATRLDGREQFAVEAFADALELVPRTLAENAGLDALDALVELRRRHDAGEAAAGVRAETADLGDATAAGIVDPLWVRRRTVAAAADAASRLLRVDAVVPAGDADE
ncbi:thermosome subunit beta [Candidatus Halobonum tyrrellensis]|uniref:Thermosome n=1 Tax=Candidatus Halobonum tyrrellensis G22 TaxID=1324957 RepID=V4IV23_9EURY|nr:thermosome subunit beta [Candidatus Halobonum tyrrellensis]ESP87057.1 thermosome [Candidatus Halobonum tyrrellensis G22]